MKRAMSIGLALTGILSLASCTFVMPIFGSGKVVSEKLALEGFSAIEASSATKVNVSIGEAYSVTLNVEDNLRSHFIISTDGKTLMAGGFDVPVSTMHGVSIDVVMPALDSLSARDASIIEAGALSATAFSVFASDASKVSIQSLASETLSASVDDASNLEISQTSSANSLSLHVSSASEAKLLSLQVVNAQIEIASASKAFVYATGSLSGSVTDASALSYKGSPSMGVSSTNASSIKKVD